MNWLQTRILGGLGSDLLVQFLFQQLIEKVKTDGQMAVLRALTIPTATLKKLAPKADQTALIAKRDAFAQSGLSLIKALAGIDG